MRNSIYYIQTGIPFSHGGPVNSKVTNVGIYGIGQYLPETIRKNDWWSPSLTQQWQERLNKVLPRVRAALPGGESESMRLSIAAMEEIQNDVFQGAEERRVMSETMCATDMEEAAARMAIKNAGIDPQEIDLLLCYGAVPDYLLVNYAAVLHKRLNLKSNCLSTIVDSTCASALMQLTLAESLIKSGRGRCALLVQSAVGTRVVDKREPFSAWLGDGATAYVVGPVSKGRGILGVSYQADGSMCKGIMCGVEGKRWYDEGHSYLYSEDWLSANLMLLNAPAIAKDLVGDALQQATLTPDDVQFYASHQPTAWFRRVTQEYAGLERARGVDVYPWATSTGPVNIGLQLCVGLNEHMIHNDDVVAFYAFGSGIMSIGMVMRWGR